MKIQISTAQAVMLLVLSRMFRTVTYSPMFEDLTEASAIVYADIISIFVTLIIILPLFILLRNGQDDILLESTKCSRKFGKVVMVYYFLLIMLVLINTTSRFEAFMSNAIFPNISSLTVIISFLLVCLYGAKMGFEAISRASSILFVIFIISLIFIFGFSFEKMHLVNLKPIIDKPISTVYELVVHNISHNMEFVLLVLFLPKVKGTFSKITLWYIFISGIFITLVGSITVLILGDFTLNQIFPFFSIASIMEGGTIQRMDSIHMALWVLISYVRVTLCLILANEVLRKITGAKNKNGKELIVIVGITAIVSYFITLDYDSIKWIPNIVNTFVPIFIATFVIPIILLIFRRKNKNEIKKVNDNN